MVQPFEDYLAATVLDYPTPSPIWYLHHDDPAHPHDDIAVARCVVAFNGKTTVYEIHGEANVVGQSWQARHVPDPIGERARGSHYSSWPECKRVFDVEWERLCAAERTRIAAEVFLRAVLISTGITNPPVERLAAVRIGGDAMKSLPFTPSFSAATFDYALTAPFPNLTATVTVPYGATVTWASGDVVGTGASFEFTVETGVNVVTATVSQENRIPATYTFTITKE